ncbi:MAG: MFS transporter [Chloroflexi bacterium]|nr:MFS transporter [Chloroflexota bacterium]
MKLGQKLTYSLGNFGNTIVYQAFTNRVQFYYIDVIGLSSSLIGSMWILFGLWNAINDPLMGQISDRTRTPLGRRIPFILFGGIPVGLTFFLLWIPPTGNRIVTAVYFLFTVFLFDTAISLLVMAYNSLFAEITDGLDERSSLSAMREAFAIVSLLAAFVLAPILSTSVGWWQMGLIIGGLGAVTCMVSVIGHKENPENYGETDTNFLANIREALSNATFRNYLGANIAKEYVFVVLAAALPFWSKYALDITGPATYFGVTLGPGDQEAVLLGVPFVMAIPILAIWNQVMKRIGVKRMWNIVFIMFIPGLLVMFFANNFWTGLVGTLAIAPALAGAMMVFMVMLSEIVDEDARRVGYRREGIFFGVNGAFQRLAYAVQGVTLAVIFGLTGFVEAGGQALVAQPASAVFGIRFLIAGTSIIACLIGLVFLRRINLPEVVEVIEKAPAPTK